MGIGHDLVPSLSGERAAGHLMHDRIIVVSEPHTTHEIAGVTDEPRIAIGVGGAGLARRLDAIENGPACSALLDRGR